MSFYQARTSGYKVAKTLGRVDALTGGGQYRGIREATYGSAKFLGDINAVTGKGKISSKIGRRLTSRFSGNILRGARLSTGIPKLDGFVARIVTEQLGKKAQALQGQMYDDSKAAFVIDSGEMEALINSPQFIDGLLNEAGFKLVSYAKSIAPKKTGKYKDSFGYTVSTNERGQKQLIIYTDDPRWKYIEYGTSKSAPQPVLRRLFEADPRIKRTQ
jgi:hypothetical protein